MSLIEQLTDYAGPNTNPLLQRDSLIQAGSQFLLDFLDSYCNANADGAVAAGATFANLVNDGRVATAAGSGIQNLTGKAGLSMPGTSNSVGVSVGPAGAYDLHATNPEILLIAWLKTPASGYVSTAYQPLFYLSGSNANASQWWMDMGSDGKTPRAAAGLGASSPALAATSGYNLGAVTQLALHWTPATGAAELWGNGAMLANTPNAFPTTMQNASAISPFLSGGYKGTIYRLYLENITASLAAGGQTAAQQIAADYAANASRFT
jgi:hypothetical protein